MAQINVAVINASTGLGDDKVEAAIPALETQVRRDFAPVWRIDAHLTFVPKRSICDQTLPNWQDVMLHCLEDEESCRKSWWLVILDNSDIAGFFGYRDFTDARLPLGKVFAKTDQDYGRQWTVTASHELLEMLADPAINLTVFRQINEAAGRLYAYDICDPCQAEEFGYEINGTLVSDFVYPAWFDAFHHPKNTQLDHCKQVREPFELLRGGYINVYDIPSGTGWRQICAGGEPLDLYDMRPRVGSRRERRRTSGQGGGQMSNPDKVRINNALTPH